MNQKTPSLTQREKLIKEINVLSRKIDQLHKKLAKGLSDGEPGIVVILQTSSENGIKYDCHYKNIKGTKGIILTRMDEMEEKDCTAIKKFHIPMIENTPMVEGTKLAGYVQLGKSKTYVPQYLSLNRAHLKKARVVGKK